MSRSPQSGSSTSDPVRAEIAKAAFVEGCSIIQSAAIEEGINKAATTSHLLLVFDARARAAAFLLAFLPALLTARAP
jgi:hypothetical protein